jgi:hypothetical protein
MPRSDHAQALDHPVWLHGDLGSVSEPDVLNGLHRFQQALQAIDPTSA